MKLGSTPFKLFAGALFVFGAQLLTPATDAQAAILAQYTFNVDEDANPTRISSPSVDIDPNSTASNFTNTAALPAQLNFASGNTTVDPNSDVPPSGPPSLSSTTAQIAASGANIGPALNNARALNSYYTFTLAPNSGFALNLEQVGFFTNLNPATGEQVFIGLDLYSDGAFVETPFQTRVIGTSSAQPLVFNFRDSGLPAFFSRPVEFRFYVADTGGSSATFNLDDVYVEGSVAPVPELPTSVLLMLGGAGFMVWRRKRGVAAPRSGRATLAA